MAIIDETSGGQEIPHFLTIFTQDFLEEILVEKGKRLSNEILGLLIADREGFDGLIQGQGAFGYNYDARTLIDRGFIRNVTDSIPFVQGAIEVALASAATHFDEEIDEETDWNIVTLTHESQPTMASFVLQRADLT